MAKMNWGRVQAESQVGHRLDGPTPRTRKGRRKPPPKRKQGFRRCKATAKGGEQCRGGAKKGSDYCGPHQAKADADYRATLEANPGANPNRQRSERGGRQQCQARRKDGQRCQGAAKAGTSYCGPHSNRPSSPRTANDTGECPGCGEAIMVGDALSRNDRNYHKSCNDVPRRERLASERGV